MLNPDGSAASSANWADELGDVVVVDGKSHEIPALPDLLQLFDVKGRTVTPTRCMRNAARRRRWTGQGNHIWILEASIRGFRDGGARLIWPCEGQFRPSGRSEGLSRRGHETTYYVPM